jgi:hypothetical protein
MHLRLIANIALYQIVWFLCVLGGNSGGMVAFVLVMLHLFFSEKRLADLKMMALLLIAGLLIDGTLLATGFFSFTKDNGWPIPLWLGVIWLGLATLVHHSLAWMRGRYLLSALFGALGGPLAYWAGERLGAMQFNLTLFSSVVILAGIWAVLWPLVIYSSCWKHDKAGEGKA